MLLAMWHSRKLAGIVPGKEAIVFLPGDKPGCHLRFMT